MMRISLITSHLSLKAYLIAGFFVFILTFLFLGSSSPAYAACPEGCTESWTPIYGTCYEERCLQHVSSSLCLRGEPGYGWCRGDCCKSSNCVGHSYTCITGWKVTCICLPPAGCNGTPCPAGFDCISGKCVPHGGDGPAPSPCDKDHPCPGGYVCEDGRCNPECQQTGSGDKCDPDQPNNGCPSGESCCWGVGECYTFCCGGGGYTPDPPAGSINLSPRINDPGSSQYFFTKTGKQYKDYFWGRGFDPYGSASACISGVATAPSATSCDFGTGMIGSWGKEEGCVWGKGEEIKYDFRPGKKDYKDYGGNFIVLRPTQTDCGEKGEDPLGPCSVSLRFRAPDDQLLRAIEFDYDNNVGGAAFGFSRYTLPRFGSCPKYEIMPGGKIPKGTGHKVVYMQPATKDVWLILHASSWYDPLWAYRAIVSDIKLHLIEVDNTGKKEIDVISNVYEPNVPAQPHHVQWVRFSNECPLGPKHNMSGGCCAGGKCWSGWVDLEKLNDAGLFGYPWELGNPTKTVWMHACTSLGLCHVFKDKIGYNPFGTVSGYIWNDLNNSDGTGKDPPGEPNYIASEITVSYSCPSKSRSKEISDGNYTFNNVPAESCTVSIGPLAPGWSNTTPASVGVTVPAGGTATVNFGVWDNPEAWFQGCNGDAYGLGVSVPVPYQCEGCCDRWLLGADPNDIAGGVVISGNANLLCSGRCSERPSGDSSAPGWNVKNQAIAWPASLSFSPPSGATTVSSADPTLQVGKSYVWSLPGNTLPSGSHKYQLGSGVAVLYVNGNFTINGKFNSGNPQAQGVIIVVNGNVTVNRDTVGDPYDTGGGRTSDIDAVIIASGTITVTGNNPKKRLVINGMLYGKGGISVTGEELENNLYPRLQTIYNPLYFHTTNPLAKNSIIWREVTP